ncbi:hypothetical protein F4860DRAFT_351090 [Xylaria cubensis]|nr:hypothetical protein F4860DRAFT_351090 [Xylaria cubensis]
MGQDIFGKGSASSPLDHPSQVVKNAPSFEDGESYLDSFGYPPPPSLIPTPLSEKRFGCSQCSFSFTEKKDLNRHKNGVHSANKEPPCSCRCGIKRVRKDKSLATLCLLLYLQVRSRLHRGGSRGIC